MAFSGTDPKLCVSVAEHTRVPRSEGIERKTGRSTCGMSVWSDGAGLMLHQIYGPRLIHGALASLTDIWTAELARNVLGKQYESAAVRHLHRTARWQG